MELGTISKEFAAALVQAQGNIEGAKKGKSNPAFKSKYADLAACWDACEAALQGAGIAVLQFPTTAGQGYVGLRTSLVFRDTGEVLSAEFAVPLKDPNNAQALGSAITYARRYSLCSIIGICPEDDDGNAAAGSRHASKSAAADAPKAPSAEDEKLAAGFTARFNGAKGVETMKAIYSEVKNSSLHETKKAELLLTMGQHIKCLMAAEGTEGKS